ncbi:DNA-directed RNA polymerase I subunit RPA34.5-domain-containing protein [Nemania abortiva]|nr:DNA-directed RNA polymerase I subunit RPA34.5-domain-containing protein [Nemania abortiva]
MRNTKANIGSLSSMASKVRQEKKNSASAKAKAPLARARESNKSFKSADTVQDSSSDSDSDSSSSSSSAGSANSSDGEDDIGAARAKFLAKQAAKQNKTAEKTKPKANGAKPTAPAAATPAKSKSTSKGGIPTSAQKPVDEYGFDSSSESESESDSAKPATSQTKVNATKAKSRSSSDSTSSSGSSSESEESGAKNKAVNGHASKSDESDNSDSDSSSDDEDVPSKLPQVNGKGPAKGPATNAQGSSSEESDSGSDSDDEGDGGRTAVAKTNGKDSAEESTSQIARPQWLNNSDFTLRKASSNNPGKEVADFFSNANLEGKQVWYFTAPASLPITVLKDMEIDLASLSKGGPLLTHNGDNYGLDLESHATNTQIQLLIPSRGGDKYTSLNHSIDSTVHLRRMAKFGPGGEVHSTATEDYVPVPRPIREQPEGLKVRYTPIGVAAPAIPSIAPPTSNLVNGFSSQTGAGVRVPTSPSVESKSDPDSDVEMTTPLAPAAPASQNKPTKSGKTNGDRKRKHTGEENQATKRLKGGVSTEASNVRSTPVQIPSSSAVSNPTPSKKPSVKSKDKKERARKDNTPKPVSVTPTTTKQTPIPLPSYPGMRR